MTRTKTIAAATAATTTVTTSMAATAKIMLSPLLDLLVKLQKLKAYHPVFFFFYCCYMS